MIKHIPLGTHIPKDTVFPVQSIIVAGTRIEYTSDNAFELAIPLGTVIYDVKSLDVVKPELKGRNSAARLPKSLVLTHPTNEQVAQAVYLPPGTVIPKFSNGEYAVIPPGTVIPLLANGAASTIPENAIITRTEKEENFIAANTVVPEGAKIPPGTVIPEGAQIPEGVVLYIPKLEDGRSAVIPPLTHIPVGAIFPEMFADKEINIPYGTTIPKSTTKTIRITPEVEVPENFQLQPSGDVKDIIVQKGTYIPKTDMLLNIPKGTVIPNNVPWTIRQTGLQTIQTFKEYLQDTQIPLKLFLAIHFFLMLYALQHVLTTPGISRSFAHLLVALFFPELYLFILFYQSRKVEQPMTGIGRVQFWAAILLVMLLGFTFILP
jgi:carbonic anhydrase/acetyltransferase-like protein (isoleucine patch superfamily)